MASTIVERIRRRVEDPHDVDPCAKVKLPPPRQCPIHPDAGVDDVLEPDS